MPETVDASERKRALDPTQSFIVQAPAGSGKTELLIQRYLRLLSGVERPEQILAMTFTIKAADEMKHRIIDALESAKFSGPPVTPHEFQTWELASKALKRDKSGAVPDGRIDSRRGRARGGARSSASLAAHRHAHGAAPRDRGAARGCGHRPP